MLDEILVNIKKDMVDLIDGLLKRFQREADNDVNFIIIINRLENYGNNFPSMAQSINKKLHTKFGSIDVVDILCELKKSRMEQYGGTQDTVVDLQNYQWIRNNYDKYLDLAKLVKSYNNINYVLEKYSMSNNNRKLSDAVLSDEFVTLHLQGTLNPD